MKKILSAIMVLILILSTCALFASCDSESSDTTTNTPTQSSSSSTVNPIVFGKKYKDGDKQYYVFNEDKTGYWEYYYKYDSSSDPSKSYVQSGRIDFQWREATDGAIYLIKIKETYNKDHTEGKKLPATITAPIYFAEDCFFYTTVEEIVSARSTTTRYTLEGSALEKALNKD